MGLPALGRGMELDLWNKLGNTTQHRPTLIPPSADSICNVQS